MSDSSLALRVAARFYQADQPPGQRQRDKKLVKPINPPKGIDRTLVRDNGKPMEEGHDETIRPNSRDIRPEDVFIQTPRNVNVRNLVETGRDQSGKVQDQIRKDKGYDSVSNLSQYLIETEGGGGAKPRGTK